MIARTYVAAALLALLAGLTACSGGSATPAAQESPSPSPSPPAYTPAPAPRVGQCYRLTPADVLAPTNAELAVACTTRHNAQTIAVGLVPRRIGGKQVDVDAPRATAFVAQRCPKAYARFAGGSQTDRDLSRLKVVWFGPSLQDAEAGARWYRCDLIGFSRGDTLMRRTKPIRRGVLGSTDRDLFALCGTAAPGKPGFQRVMCSLDDRWRAIATIPLGDGSYPGSAAVREAGDQPCADLTREAQDFALTYTYGWEWPTLAQWQSGQHFGFCWSPRV
ncbi:MAG: septum formation family protein [Nocardioidaceae bacterium]